MSELDEAVDAALSGQLVVLPTDTVYGIATRPDDRAATARLFDAKRRPRDLTLPVLVASEGDAAAVGILDGRARAMIRRFWPGPLTIVVPRAERSLAWDLGGEAETVGLRRPRHLLALAVLERTGPLAVTSANLSGRPTASTCEDLVATFGDDVAVYLCQEESLEGVASTVVGLAHGEPAILREGGIRAADVLHVLRAADVAPGS